MQEEEQEQELQRRTGQKSRKDTPMEMIYLNIREKERERS